MARDHSICFPMMRMLLFGIFAGAVEPATAVPAGEPESCEFRVVNWNAAGSDEDFNAGQDFPIALSVLSYVTLIDANVVTLQEVTDLSLSHLEGLLPGWECHSALFGVDDIAVCVDGIATNFYATPLMDHYEEGDEIIAFPWWGYVQVEYEGVSITSVHTRSAWRDEHVAELHEAVTSGIVAGDFNHIDAADPGWFQTDLDLEWTWEGSYRGMDGQWKIDHVLSVEEPQQVWGDAAEKEGSNHRVVLAEIAYPPQAPAIDASITNAVQPIEVDGSCAAMVGFQITIHDNCCLDPEDLALEVTAGNPTSNATLGPVAIDGIAALGPRDVLVTGHVAVSALESCPAQIVIAAMAQDCAGNAGDTASQGTSGSVLALDTTPPEVAGGGGDLYCLWPPNHEYVCFDAGQFSPVITDNCAADPTWEFDACASDQPDNGPGDGNTINDCVVDAHAQGVCARAERAGGIAAGRRYTLDIEAMDTCGNASASTELGSIYVPRNQSPALACLAPPGP